MLGEITCDTEILQLLQISEVEGYLNQCNHGISSYKKEVTEELERGMKTGGLSKEAFEIDGSPLLYDCTVKVTNQLEELETTTTNFREKILSLAQEQRTKELVKLRQKISEKISEINDEIYATQSIIMDIKGLITPDSSSVKSYQNKLESLRSEKLKYETKYQEVLNQS